MDLVFFIYGLAFVALGVVVLAQPRVEGRYTITGDAWLLALFGLLHGLLEWTDLWRLLHGSEALLGWLQPALLLLSYGALFEFGRRLVVTDCRLAAGHWPRLCRPMAGPVYGLVAVLFVALLLAEPDRHLALELGARYGLGFTGAALTGYGLWHYFRLAVAGQSVSGDTWYVTAGFRVAAAAFLLYAVLGGLVTPAARFSLFDYAAFQATFGIPVQLLRAACAAVIAAGMGGMLQLFHAESRRLLHDAYQEAERHAVELRRSEAKLSEITAVLAEGVYVLDENGLVTFVNPAAEALLGWPAADLIGRNGHDTFHQLRPDGTAVPVSACPVHNTIATGRSYRVEEDWFVRRDGSHLPVAVVSTPILRDGRVAGSVVAFHDITSRLENQRHLRESEARFRNVMEHAPIGMATAAPDGHFLEVNRALCQLLGYSKEELQQLSFIDVSHADDRGISSDQARRLLAGEIGEYKLEKRYLPKRGGPVWVQLTVSLLRDTDGSPLYFIGQVEDISERKAAEQALHESEARYRLLFNSGNDGIMVHRIGPGGVPGKFVEVNDVACRMLGYTREELLQRGPLDLDDPAAPADLDKAIAEIRRTGSAVFERNHLTKDGRSIAVEISTHRFLFRDEPLMLAVVRDISERRQSELEYKTILNTALDGFLLVDTAAGRILDVNDAYGTMLGYTRDELLRMRVADVEAIESPAEIAAHMAQQLAQGFGRFETRHRRKDGAVIDVEISSRYLPLRGGVLITFVRDITERKQTEEQIRQLAYYDSLTQLPNRRMLLDRLGQALAQARRYRRSLGVMFLDLDHFKLINDTLGHEIGDELLKSVATRLTGCVRRGDTVARQGGDEFVIVLAELCHPDDATAVADKIITALDQPLAVAGHELRITTSIGIAVYPVNGTDDGLELMRKADMAMYAAKNQGRNRYAMYREGEEYQSSRV